MVQLLDKPEAQFKLSYYKVDLNNDLILRGWVSLWLALIGHYCPPKGC